ncbi:MAG: hypothetical protein OEZ65_12300 [Gemmatimonadota bacterium]|nr:hypothetical protein [Gemmatimonadota bacterium]
MSPAARGALPGLFLALFAAVAVLGLNDNWLLPSAGVDGVAYLWAAPALAAGEAPLVPLAPWDDPDTLSVVSSRGAGMPVAMSWVVRTGRPPHVAALWVLGGAVAVAVFAVAWVAGGMAGMAGALAAGLIFLVGSTTLDAATSIRPELLVAALVGLQMGLMAYQPRWHVGHGLLGAVAWWVHPVGLGAVAAALVWPGMVCRLAERTRVAHGEADPGEEVSGRLRCPGAWAGAAAAFVGPVLLLAAGVRFGGAALPGSLAGPHLSAVLGTGGGVIRWGGGGVPGGWGSLLGFVVMAVGILAVVRDARTTPVPPDDVHWTDPAAADRVALFARPAAGVLALALLLTAAAVRVEPGSLAVLWMPVTVPLSVLMGASAVRLWPGELGRGRGRAGGTGAGGLAGWRTPLWVLLGWIVVSGSVSWRSASAVRETGRGYTEGRWVPSEIMRWVDNRSYEWERVYATDPGLILLHSGRRAAGLPRTVSGWGAFGAFVRAAPGALVFSGPVPEEAEEVLKGFRKVVEVAEGSVWVPDADGGAPALRP